MAKIKNIEECESLLEIDVPKERIEKALDDVYEEITKYAEIPGFRAGKAPKELVKKHYAKSAREEALKRLIPEAYKNAVLEHKLAPIGLPEISDVKFEDESVLSFKAKVSTRPKFKLKNYKGLKVGKKKVSVQENDIDKMISNLRDLNARYTSVEDRPARMGDYIVSDLDCFVDGKPMHKTRENLWLFLDKDSLVPGLSEKMVGMKKGDERDIEAAVPEKYPDRELAGKAAKYHVKAKEIKMRELPPVDDEFAKIFGKASMLELKTEISKELDARARMDAEIDVENKLLAALIDDNVFSVPSDFVKRQLEFMVEEAKRHLVEKGFKKEELDKRDNELKEKFKPEAQRKVRLLFILDEIADAEKISVSDEDVDKAYKTIAHSSGKSEKEIREYYEKEEMIDGLKDKLREGKVIQLVLDNAQVTEKT